MIKNKIKIFNFLNVKNNQDPLTNDNLYEFILKKEYTKNQNIAFWGVFIGYLVYYLTRKQWSVFGTGLMENGPNGEPILSKDNYALIGLIFSISYGVAKFATSPLSDTKSNKWLLGIGLIGAGIFNLTMGLAWTNATATNILTAVVLTCVIQVLIGLVHSLGAIPSVRFFYNWFNSKQRKSRYIVWNVAHNIGGAIAAFVILGSQMFFQYIFPAGSSMQYLAYFLLPSIISVIVGLLIIIFLKDSPESVGLPSVQEYYNQELIGPASKQVHDEEAGKSWSYFFVKYVLKNKFIWLLFFTNLFAYTLKMGLSDWSMLYFSKVHNFSVKDEGKWIFSMFEWGGLAMTLIVGLLANKYLKRFIWVTIISIFLSTFALLGIWQFSNGNIGALSAFMFLAGFIFLPQCFLGIVTWEFCHHRVVSTAFGVLGIGGYIGDALMSKVVIGIGLVPNAANQTIAEAWNPTFIFLIICGAICCGLLIPMLKKRSS